MLFCHSSLAEVLFKQKDDQYLVSNKLSGSDSDGLHYRDSMSMNDRSVGANNYARYGSTVIAAHDVENWIAVKNVGMLSREHLVRLLSVWKQQSHERAVWAYGHAITDLGLDFRQSYLDLRLACLKHPAMVVDALINKHGIYKAAQLLIDGADDHLADSTEEDMYVNELSMNQVRLIFEDLMSLE
jgi:hypothetical protein